MTYNTNEAAYEWFKKKKFTCSFKVMKNVFDFSDPELRFTGMAYGKKDGGFTFYGLNFIEMTRPSSNGHYPPVEKGKTTHFEITIDGINNCETITIKL